jgi:hypothetical protein
MSPVAPPLDPKNKHRVSEKLITPFDRTSRVVLGIRPEHVPKRTLAGITSKKNDFGWFSAFLGTIVGTIKNLIIPLDKARRVVLGTRLEHLENVPRRIPAGITRIHC